MRSIICGLKLYLCAEITVSVVGGNNCSCLYAAGYTTNQSQFFISAVMHKVLYWIFMSLFFFIPDIILTIARLSKLCVIRITKDLIFLIIVEENVNVGKPMVWGVMEQTHFFNEYNMAGVSEEQNEIYLEFETGVYF